MDAWGWSLAIVSGTVFGFLPAAFMGIKAGASAFLALVALIGVFGLLTMGLGYLFGTIMIPAAFVGMLAGAMIRYTVLAFRSDR